MSKSKENKEDSAEYNRSLGEEEIKTSCIFCKFKPNYMDAIHPFEKAADQYHGLKDWENEIYCRIRLAACFKETNSRWEEANEFNKIAMIKLNQQSKPDEAFDAIQNAHQSFYLGHEYESSIKCMVKMANEYIGRNDYDYGERILKITYETVLKIFHVITLSNNDDILYIHDMMDTYLGLIIRNGNINQMISTTETFIKLLKEDSKNKEQISHLYGMLLAVSLIISDGNKYEEIMKIVESGGYENEEINHVIIIKECLETLNEKEFKSTMIDIQGDFPNIISQKLTTLYKTKGNNGNELTEIKLDIDNKKAKNDEEDWK